MPPPFSIKDKKESLFLLAHLLGDLHQPLHIGAVSLSDAGKEVHPDKPDMTPQKKVESETAGGNVLELGSAKLHSIWDEEPNAWPTRGHGQIAVRAKLIPPTNAHVEMLVALWADTVKQSDKAFAGLNFSPKSGRDWKFKLTDPDCRKHLNDIAQEQVARDGSRLGNCSI